MDIDDSRVLHDERMAICYLHRATPRLNTSNNTEAHAGHIGNQRKARTYILNILIPLVMSLTLKFKIRPIDFLERRK